MERVHTHACVGTTSPPCYRCSSRGPVSAICLPSQEVSFTPQSSQRTCSQVAPLALSCDHHMTTVGAAGNGHVTTARFNQSNPISSRSTSVRAPPHADCLPFLRTHFLFCPLPVHRQGELHWLQPPLVACDGLAGLLVDAPHLSLRLSVLEDDIM